MENLSGTKVPILTKEDLESLEEMCGTTSGYFYKMLDYLDERVRDGVRRGLFTQEQAEEDRWREKIRAGNQATGGCGG